MMLTKPTRFLPLLQVIIAISLLVLGSRQSSTSVQDSSPFVPLATKVCEAINAPAALLAVALLRLRSVVHLRPGVAEATIGEVAFVAGIVFLWFLVGLEIESQPKSKVSSRRWGWPLVEALLIGTAAILALFGLAEWHQGEIILAVGALTWSLILAAFYGVRLIRSLLAYQRDI
jgi:hypothetical protein